MGGATVEWGGKGNSSWGRGWGNRRGSTAEGDFTSKNTP